MRFNQTEFRNTLRRAIQNGARMANQEGALRALRLDSSVINLERDFTVRLSEVYRDKFPDLRALDFVPMLEAPVFQTATGYIGEFLTRVGEAKMVTEVSTDVPLVTLQGQTFTGKVATYGAAGAWSQMDIFRAAIGTVNIPVETQRAARETIETKTDNILSTGERGIPGFLNHPDVATVPFGLGNWGTRTFEQVIADVHAWVGSLHQRVAYIERSKPDTILFPDAAKTLLVGKRNTFGVSAWATLVQELRDMYRISVDTWSKLHTAGAGSVPRTVAYRRDPKCIGALVPMPYTEFQPQERGFQVIVPALASCGGVVLIEADTVAYADNATV